MTILNFGSILSFFLYFGFVFIKAVRMKLRHMFKKRRRNWSHNKKWLSSLIWGKTETEDYVKSIKETEEKAAAESKKEAQSQAIPSIELDINSQKKTNDSKKSADTENKKNGKSSSE